MSKQEGLDEMLAKKEITQEMHEWISNYSGCTQKIYSPDIAVAMTERSEWGGSGGIGYWDQARVYYKGQIEMQEWNWRHRYNQSQDRHSLRIHGFGEMKEETKDEKIIISIQILNKALYQEHRWESFEFKNAEVKTFQKLSDKEQSKFAEIVEKEIDKIIAKLNQLWKLKPKMMASAPGCYGGYTNYSTPTLKQREINKAVGVAAFVTQEQIDHDGADPQYRYEVFVVSHEVNKAKQIFEDHAYENREGSALVSIVTLNPEEIVLNTRKGKRTIKIT